MHLSRPGLVLALAVASAAGCGFGPSPECQAYVACAEHYADTSGLDVKNLDAYKEGGACWSDPAQARACTRACREGSEGYRDALEQVGEDAGPCAP